MQDLFDLNQEHLVGKLIRAPKGNCALGQLSVPLAKDVLVLSAADLQHTDMKILADLFPVLAGNIVKFDNQSVLAVFGPSYEAVELYASQIEMDYLPIENEVTPSVYRKNYKVVGPAYDSIEGEEFESSLTFNSHTESTISGQRVHAVFQDGKIHIKCVSQWPMHIKQQVAEELGISPQDVIVYPQNCYASSDQLVYQPTITGILASVAAMKSSKLVELSVPMTSTQPQLEFNFKTKTDSNKNIVAHKAVVSADLGCYPIFASEYCNAVISAMAPPYPLISLNLEASALASGNPPACFFKDLGYGAALAATEIHFSKLAKHLGKSPAVLRTKMFEQIPVLGTAVKGRLMDSPVYDLLPQTLKACVNDSFFERYNAAYSQKTVHSNTDYCRGIGVSCGEGTQGFSSEFPYLKDYYVSVSKDDYGNVMISKSLQSSESNIELWRNLVAKQLEVDSANVRFADINDFGVADNGPAVLSRSNSFIAVMLEKACQDIKNRCNEGYPITSTISFTPNPSTLFTSYCNGTMTMGLHVDWLSFMPVVDSVTVRLAFGKILNPAGLKSHLRHTIINTIAEICPDINLNFNIDLKTAQDSSKPVGSADSLVRGLTISSFVSALSQAMKTNITSIPISREEIFELTRKKEEEKDENINDN